MFRGIVDPGVRNGVALLVAVSDGSAGGARFAALGMSERASDAGGKVEHAGFCEMLRYRFEQSLVYKAIVARGRGAVDSARNAQTRDRGGTEPAAAGQPGRWSAGSCTVLRAFQKKSGYRQCPERDWPRHHREVHRKQVKLQILWNG